MNKFVVATWSGGIDSTAVIAHLLKRSWHVRAVTLEFGPPRFMERERQARRQLLSELLYVAGRWNGIFEWDEKPAPWLWEFSDGGMEIPRRNKHIMDYLIVRECIPRGIKNLAMGEYTGADTWVVRDHVAANDCDHRALSAYLYLEYGLDWRLISLQDFGESRYKANRLRLGLEVLGAEGMAKTTNCLNDVPIHCGTCYKCIERAAAFDVNGIEDHTHYDKDPRMQERWPLYMEQMKGCLA